MGRVTLAILLLAVLVAASCETAQEHKPVTRPPAAALAPLPAQATTPRATLSAEPPQNAQNAQTSKPPVAKTPSSPDAAKLAAISQLIERAEAAYTAGLEDYQSGDFEKARQEFDQSLAVLLTSPYDIRSDNHLSEEFDLLADHINQVEVEALQQGNSLSVHPYAQTPIESFSGLTFPVNPAVEARVQQEVRSVHLDIPLISNATVSGIIAYFQAHARGYITHVLEGLDEYGPMISAALKKEGLPHDLLYLPGPESGFNPHATSRKGAKGIWQLMRGTAALHGLKDNRWIDEREDPYRSTQAAAAELKSLYQQFGDWYLALAAYDSGPGNVQRAIQQTGYADYWKLRSIHALLPETENYVPLFLATALIAKDPKAYGFAPGSAAPLKVDRIRAGGQLDLRLVAGIVGTPVDTLVRLNPALQGYETPPADPSFMLNLPAGTKGTFEREIALVPPQDRLWWRAVHMDGGETIASVARRFRVSPEAVAAANRVALSDPLSAGSPLLIPLAPVRTEANARFGLRYVRRRYYYRVRRGDNLELIADRFDVSTYQLRRWNHLRSSRLISGRRLLVYRRVAIRVRPHHRLRRYVPRRIVHRVHHHSASRRAANSALPSAAR